MPDPDASALDRLSVAVMLPCYNEEVAIAGVVGDFRKALPTARVYVYDNNSTDRTAARAGAAGATVCAEPIQGKGQVVRRMFADIDADIYVMADGDGTYDAFGAPALIARLVADNLDMVVGSRLDSDDREAFRSGHRFGNRALAWVVSGLFGKRLGDMLSGYRVLSRRFVKSFPALSKGFEIETELTVHAMELRMPMTEIETRYRARPEGSASKLSTVRDGNRILWSLAMLLKEVKPFHFFGVIALVLALLSLALAYPIFVTFVDTGLVPRFPTAILATGIMLLGFISLTCGLILDNVSRGRREAKHLAYLVIPSPRQALERAG